MTSSAAPLAADAELARKRAIQAGKRRAPQIGGLSGTESDSDSILSPDTAGPTASFGVAPLTAIAERRPGPGEESEEDDDDDEGGAGGWRIADKTNAMNAGDIVIKSGYLSKKGARRKTWKKRWFVLRPAHLAYYKSNAEYKLLRLLDLSDVHAITPIFLKRHEHTFGIVTHSRTFYLQAGNRDDLDAWVAILNETRQQLLSTASASSLPTPVQTPVTASTTLKEAPPAPPRTPPPPHVTEQHTGSSSESDEPGYSASPIATSKDPSKDLAVKPVLSGYLMKCGSKRRNWRKRWFVLTADKLIYSGSHMDKKPHRQIPLSTVLDALELATPHHRPSHHSTSQAPSSPSPLSGSAIAETEAAIPGKSFTFKIITPKRTLLLCAPSEEEEIKWLSAVRALIARRAGTGAKDPASLPVGISASSSGGAGKAPSSVPLDGLPSTSSADRRRGSNSESKRVTSISRNPDPAVPDKT